jgi:hypothetical protein
VADAATASDYRNPYRELVARVSVATGIGPAELVELDGEMFDELVGAVDRRWTPELELAAASLEVSSAQLVAYLRAHTRKGRVSLAPIEVPRPAWVGEQRSSSSSSSPATRVSVRELAELAGRAIEQPEAPSG